MTLETEHRDALLRKLKDAAVEAGFRDLDQGLARPELAKLLDNKDELSSYRDKFCIPKKSLGEETDCPEKTQSDCLYFCGNSLGLQPKRTKEIVNEELEAWASRGVEGHFKGKRPWLHIDEFVQKQMAQVVGANAEEVSVMNSLTTNLHLMLIPFYRPTSERKKLVIEAQSFPSDLYAAQSQIKLHGHDVEECLVELKPAAGETYLKTEDIIAYIQKEGSSIATIVLPGVQYYTGQYFNIKAITAAAHEQGCMIGWDLAHAVGNCPLELHEWGVDFAVWCTYKYLNSGPGCIGGAFLHEKHASSDLRQLAGWWGHDLATRFEMDESTFSPIAGAFRFRLSNPPVLPVVQLLASLELFEEVGMKKLRTKSELLSFYLESLLRFHFPTSLEILTPQNPAERGCQLSIRFKKEGTDEHELTKKLADNLVSRGVVCDVRKPAVMRVAPTPFYNSFTDVFEFVSIVKEVFG